MFDGLGGVLQDALAREGGMSGLFATAFQGAGGFDGVLAKLNNAGLGAQVNSWLGKGENLPLTAEEIQGALGEEHLKQLATALGVPMDQVAGVLAQHLPAAVDKASPNGVLQA
jgi:uncharacterized protein YidB (DUF937 family)